MVSERRGRSPDSALENVKRALNVLFLGRPGGRVEGASTKQRSRFTSGFINGHGAAVIFLKPPNSNGNAWP
jgi:hypothetical protein